MAQNIRINMALNSASAVKGVANLQKAFDKLKKSGGTLKITKTSDQMQRMGKRAKASRDRVRMLNEQFGKFAVSSEKVANKTRAVSKGLARTNTQLKKTAVSSKLAAGGFKAMGASILGVVGAYAGFHLVRSATDNVIGFSRAMAEVQTIARLAPKQLKAAKDEILKISAATGKGPTELAKAFYQIQSAGIKDTAAAANVLNSSAKLSVAGLSDMGSTVNAVTKILSSYSGQFKNATEITDVFFDAVDLGQVTVEELAVGLPQVASLAGGLGLSFQDVTGAVSAFSKKAGSAALGATQLKSVLTGLAKGQDRAKKVLKDNGAAFSIQALNSKRLAVFLRELNKETNGSVVTLQKLFGRVEALTGVTAGASDNFEDLERIMDLTGKTAGSTEKAFKTITEEIGGKLDLIANKKKVLEIKIGDIGLSPVLDILNEIDERLALYIKNFEVVVRKIKSLLITVGLLAFVFFSRRAIISMLAVRTQFLAMQLAVKNGFLSMRVSAATSMSGISISTKGASLSIWTFVKTLKIAKIAVASFKVVATFGLSLALDFIIFKFLELKDQFGTWSKVLDFFVLHTKIALKKAELQWDSYKFFIIGILTAVVANINKLFAKVNKIFGTKFRVVAFDSLVKSLDKSVKGMEKTRKELKGLEKDLEDFKTKSKVAVDPGLNTKDPLTNLGGKNKAKVTGVPGTEAIADKLQSTRDQILLFNEETRLLINERERLASDEQFAFLQERLGTEKAFKAIAQKEAMKNLKMGKKGELEFEKQIAAEKRKAALEELKFSNMTNMQKIKQTQNTLQLIVGLTKAAGGKMFGITKAIALSESVVSGILAVQKALSSAPYPLNLVNASIVGATAAINTANIASSKPPSYRTGGFVPGTPTGGRDSVLANLEPKEAVITQSQQRNFLRLANGEGAGGDGQLLTAIMDLKNAILNNPTSIEISGRQVALAMRDQKMAGVTI